MSREAGRRRWGTKEAKRRWGVRMEESGFSIPRVVRAAAFKKRCGWPE